MIRITLNGEARDIPDGLDLTGLLAHLALDPRMVVVEHNRAIVRKGKLDGVKVAAGDEIELVHFVGGG
ncbi:MAG TPA: sulfur carrier protein ThiS [Gemmatimonadales bacterium]|nr:sulfur carrier protein ThiS [Gemmatimonadales bacterium]